ncbi:MAG: hypothetical protein IPK63_16210 [Candidatus Competibacteraceae bacterium]|nr:hypothetical protein [Candidatus Competibacteraceae bacterium]
MSQLDDIMSSVGIPKIKDVFGDSATYTIDDTAETMSVKAILTRGVVNPLDARGVNEKITTIQIANSDLAGHSPKRKDEVLIGSERFIVLERSNDDGYFTTLIVRTGDD